MALIVHAHITHEGKTFVRGAVLRGVIEDEVARKPHLARHCSYVPDNLLDLPPEASPEAPAEVVAETVPFGEIEHEE